MRKVRTARTLYAERSMPVPDICRTLGISRATFYRYITIGQAE
ncbi:MAG: helix-turn-helix domain-containing protein [Verrucomicrobiales bacterium]